MSANKLWINTEQADLWISVSFIHRMSAIEHNYHPQSVHWRSRASKWF